MNNLFKFAGARKPLRSRSKRHKPTYHDFFKFTAKTVTALLVVLIATTLPKISFSQDENSQFCTIDRGTINDQSQFTSSSSGTDFKITCAGALSGDLTNASIQSVLDSLSGFQEGVSTVLLDVSGVTSEDHGIDFVSDALLNIFTGQLTNDASVTDGFAVTFRGENPATNNGDVYDINVENRATILVQGEGRRGIRATHGYTDGNINLVNYGRVTTEGDAFSRDPGQMYRDRRTNAVEGIIDSANGDITVTNEVGATIHTKGSGARGIHAWTGGTGAVEVHNKGVVITEGGIFKGAEYPWESHAINAGSTNGNAKAVNHKSGTITTGVEGDTVKGEESHGVRAYSDADDGQSEAVAENHGTITTYGKEARGVSSSTCATQKCRETSDPTSESAGEAISKNTGTITTHGQTARALMASSAGSNAGDVRVENSASGTITTHGEHGDGMVAWSIDNDRPNSRISVTNEGTVITNGAYSEGAYAYYLIYSATDKDAPGHATATNSGQITVKGDNTEGTIGSNSTGLAAGYWINTNPELGVLGGIILNSGDATVVNNGSIIASGNKATGLFAEAFGDGNVTINNYGSVVAGTMADSEATPPGGKFGVGIYGEVATDSTTDDPNDDVDVMILVSGSASILAYGADSDDQNTGDYDESKGIAILADSGGENINNVYTGHSRVDISDGVQVKAFGANDEHGNAVMFRGGRGTLNLTNGSLVGNISFTDGVHDDLFAIEQVGSGSIDGNIDFFGGEDVMNIQIAENQHFVINGNIMGLETMNKTGSGFLRLNGEVQFEGSTLNLDEGVLVIAGQLNLGTGKMTVKEASKLIFEIGEEHNHGYVSAGSVHFDSDNPVVFAQVSESADATKVREQISSGLPFFYVSGIDGITSGMDESPVPVTEIKVQSESSGGTEDVGNVVIDDGGVGMVAFDNVDQVAVLDLPEEMVTTSEDSTDDTTSDGSSGETSSDSSSGDSTDDDSSSDGEAMMPGDDQTPPPTAPSASSSSSSGGAVLGIGLLAVLMSSFMADEDASASFGDYYFNTPQSAYIAQANERGVMTIKETGNQPYQMWIRTGHTAQPMRMTGVSNTGVSGTEVGVNLYNSDTFYINTSVAPNVSAEVGSLNLAAKGEVYSLSSGWRNDRYFGGLRVSHGEFEVNSIVDNPIVNSALISNAKLRNTQAQLRAGMNLSTGALRFTPSASIQVGTYENSEHVAESPALEANIPGYTQDYTSVQLGLKMTSDKWLSFTNGSKWKPQLKFDSIHTDSKDAGSLTLRQSDKAGALSFNSNAGLRSMPDVVNSMSFGAKVKSSTNDQAEWKFGFAGLEADGEEYYAAMAAYQLKF